MRILFFAESLIAGGQERRMLELIGYLKKHTDWQIALVITEEEVFYKYVYNLNIQLKIFKRKIFKYDPLLFISFMNFCREFNPDIIHAWGKMPTFYSIPAKLLLRKPLISNLISNSRSITNNPIMDRIFYLSDIHFSDRILSNSFAGLKEYKVFSEKARVIYNGVNLERFQENYDISRIREKFGIKTKYAVINVACFTESKDYGLFIDVAREFQKTRDDVTFIGVGDGPRLGRIRARIKEEGIKNVLLTGDQEEVEPIIAASDIGILCTYSEGISNSIIEYMALGKPAIATDVTGGTKELIIDGETGYCTEREMKLVFSKIQSLLNNDKLRISMGNKGMDRIAKYFSIDHMGKEYVDLYIGLLPRKE